MTLVVSIQLCGCQTWTLVADYDRKIQVFETKCQRMCAEQNYLPCGSTGSLSGSVERRKLAAWFGDVSCHDSFKKKQQQHLSWHLEIWATQQSAEIMLDGTIWKSACPCPCLNFSQWLPAEKTARGVLLNRSSFVLNDPVGRTTWL